MKLVNLYAPGDVRIDEVEAPRPGPVDAVIKVAACGICGTDVALARAGPRNPAFLAAGPMPLGHEAAGVVVEAGPAARGIAPGMRVAINPMGEMTNVIGNGGSEGAFTDYLLVRNAELGRNLIAAPDHLPLSIAAAAEPLGVALHAVNRSGARAGETAAVFGVGPIGLGAVIWLREKGVRDIVAVDVSPERLALAERFGASTLVRADRDDLEAALTAAHGRETLMGKPCVGTDVFIDAAGAPQVVPSVIAVCKQHARLVIPAVYREAVPVRFGDMLAKELVITTSMGYPDEFGWVVERLARDPAMFEPYISQRFPFARFHEALEAASRSSGKVMVEFEAAS